VLSFVRACRTFAGRFGCAIDGELFDENVWRNDWFQLQRDLGECRRRKGKPSEPPDAGHTGNGRRQSACQLPPDVPVFVGRSNQLHALDKLLEQHEAKILANPTVVIEGMPGVGKTTLAAHWAHRVQQRFDGGVLFIDLRGVGPEAPMTTEQALAAVLTALGAPSGDTSALPGLVAQYRAATADRPILLILDNVASIDQVHALLPATAGSMVLMTSRHNMSGSAFHAGIYRITLQSMSEAESRDLLVRLMGDHGRHPDGDLKKIADLCGRLPLALCVVAERATLSRHMPLETLGDELRAEGGATTPWIAFSWSYAALSEADRAAFRLLSLHPTTEFSRHAAAALLGRSAGETRRRLDVLVSAHLLDEVAVGRYRLHDLVAVYARSQCEENDDEYTRESAVRRLLGWYLHTADAAARLLTVRRRIALDPPAPSIRPLAFPDAEQAVRWCDIECANLVTAARLASSIGEHRTAWQLPDVLLPYFDIRRLRLTWIEVYRVAVESARKAGDLLGLAHSLNSLGTAYRAARSLDSAMRCFEEALSAYNTLGDLEGQAHVLGNLGSTARDLGSRHIALTWYQQCHQVSLRSGNDAALSISLQNLAEAELDLGLHVQAFTHAESSLALSRELGDVVGEGRSLVALGRAYAGIEVHHEAIDRLQCAVMILEEVDDLPGVAHALAGLGRLLQSTGRVEHARAVFSHALEIFEDLGDSRAAEVRRRLGICAE
jgi:tetratricopeptide (TPR) repeat protein